MSIKLEIPICVNIHDFKNPWDLTSSEKYQIDELASDVFNDYISNQLGNCEILEDDLIDTLEANAIEVEDVNGSVANFRNLQDTITFEIEIAAGPEVDPDDLVNQIDSLLGEYIQDFGSTTIEIQSDDEEYYGANEIEISFEVI